MRAYSVAAILVSAFSLSACGGLGSGGQMAGPPDWFLRDHEKQQIAAARTAPRGALTFAVPTNQSPSVYRERVAFLIEKCWIDGEPGWRLRRGPGRQELSLIEIPLSDQQPRSAPDGVAVRFAVQKGDGPGLLVRASGALATEPQRDRLRRSLERASTFNPAAPHCPSYADDAERDATA